MPKPHPYYCRHCWKEHKLKVGMRFGIVRTEMTPQGEHREIDGYWCPECSNVTDKTGYKLYTEEHELGVIDQEEIHMIELKKQAKKNKIQGWAAW